MRRRAGGLAGPAAAVAVLAAVAGCTPSVEARFTTPGAASPAAPDTSVHEPTLEPTIPLRAGERFTTLAAVRPYAPDPPAGGTDEYRCFLVDPGLRKPTFLTGSQFLPRNADIVHHAIFYRVAREDVAEARGLD